MKRRSQRGHAMLELAISAGVMVACLGGTFEFGYTFYAYNQLVTAVGNGARYAAMRPAGPDVDKDKALVRNMVVYGTTQPPVGAAPVVKDLRPEHISVEFIGGSAGSPESVRISVEQFKIDALFATFDFSGRPAVEFPYVGSAVNGESQP